MQEKNETIKVVELFAGVGGFRLGLEGYDKKSSTSGYKEEYESPYEVVWSNQYEPSTKTQHASDVYVNRFRKEKHSNKDIEKVIEEEFSLIPTHDLLVGGFPCQDYSVATTLNNSKGLKGKKGILWWSIHKILEEKKEDKPNYLFLENVDRLLKSPASQRGRDFAVMLQSLNQLGYAIEWRVINAADYGMPQRRRRVFIIGYHKSTSAYERLKKSKKLSWITKEGTIAKAFPVFDAKISEPIKLEEDLSDITNNFNKSGKLSPFLNSGVLIEGEVYTSKTKPNYIGRKKVLRDILQNEEKTHGFLLDDSLLKNVKSVNNKDGSKKEITTSNEMWAYLKGAKKERRKTKDGFEYNYAEGAMIYPDSLDKPSRTIITGEGGKSPSRFKHVVETDGGLRRLTPVELERLNMFPDNHTKLDGVTDAKRAFFMGNALVVGVIEKIGKELYKQIKDGQTK
tara:strand:- start:11847 stop:13208 length:1362 start_codon:yes stop_codon:yes gene_type:complete